jgi:hypothetical protein
MNFDKLPDEVLVIIFSYLKIDYFCASVRDVSIRWRIVSESDLIWRNLCINPRRRISKEEIDMMLKDMAKLRAIEYHENCDIIGTLSQYCTSIRVLHTSRVIINATELNAAMERLPKLSELRILIGLDGEGL